MPVSEKKLKIIREKTCDGNTRIAGFFHQPTKTFFLVDRLKEMKEVKLGQFMDRLLEDGTGRKDFDAFMEIPELRRLWEEIQKTLTPRFNMGQQAVRFFYKGNQRTPEAVTVGKILSWRKICRKDQEKPEYICKREVTRPDLTRTEIDERELHERSKLDEWNTGKSIVSQVKKEFKKTGLVGCTIFYQDRVYRF